MSSLFGAIDAAACGSILLFALPVIIGVSAVFFFRRANKKPVQSTIAPPAQATPARPTERLPELELEEPVRR